jgi:hypothetical protein
MSGQQITTLGFTFFVGIAAGFYLYVIGFAPQVAKVSDTLGMDGSSTNYDKGLVIEGTLYGSCLSACASFQLRPDGTYTVLLAPGASPKTGELPRVVSADLKKVATKQLLARLAEPSAAASCASDNGGLDAVYDIALNGEVFTVDSCTTALSSQNDLAPILDSIWNTLLNAES